MSDFEQSIEAEVGDRIVITAENLSVTTYGYVRDSGKRLRESNRFELGPQNPNYTFRVPSTEVWTVFVHDIRAGRITTSVVKGRS